MYLCRSAWEEEMTEFFPQWESVWIIFSPVIFVECGCFLSSSVVQFIQRRKKTVKKKRSGAKWREEVSLSSLILTFFPCSLRKVKNRLFLACIEVHYVYTYKYMDYTVESLFVLDCIMTTDGHDRIINILKDTLFSLRPHLQFLSTLRLHILKVSTMS